MGPKEIRFFDCLPSFQNGDETRDEMTAIRTLEYQIVSAENKMQRKGVPNSTERLEALEQEIALRSVSMENFKIKAREQKLIDARKNEMVMDDIKLLVNDSLSLRFELDVLKVEREELSDEVSSVRLITKESELRYNLIEEEKVKAVMDLEKFREQNLKVEGEKEALMIKNKFLEEAKLLVDNSLKVERKELTDKMSSLRLIIGEVEIRYTLIEEEKVKAVMEIDNLLAELREQNLKAEVLKVETKELTDEISSLRLIIGEGEIRYKLVEEEKLKSVMENEILLAELRERNLKSEKEIETLIIYNKSLEKENTRPTLDIDSLRSTLREQIVKYDSTKEEGTGESSSLRETLVMDKGIHCQGNNYLDMCKEEMLQGLDRSQRLELDILLYNKNVLSPQEGRSREHKDLISNTDRDLLMMDSFLSSDIFYGENSERY
jgi:hypothetical protein